MKKKNLLGQKDGNKQWFKWNVGLYSETLSLLFISFLTLKTFTALKIDT